MKKFLTLTLLFIVLITSIFTISCTKKNSIENSDSNNTTTSSPNTSQDKKPSDIRDYFVGDWYDEDETLCLSIILPKGGTYEETNPILVKDIKRSTLGYFVYDCIEGETSSGDLSVYYLMSEKNGFFLCKDLKTLTDLSKQYHRKK